MSKRHNLSLQELFRLGYQQRTWQSFLLKGSKCFISSCVLRYANSYYTGHCLFRGVRRNFTAIICFASLAFAHLVQEEKNWGQTDSKQGSEKKKKALHSRDCWFAVQNLSSDHCLQNSDYFGTIHCDCKIKSGSVWNKNNSFGLLSAIPGHALPAGLFCGI